MRFDTFRHRAFWFSFVLSFGLMGSHLQARAAVVSWSGGGADQNWTTGGAGGNWSGDAVPGAADDVVFTDVAGGGSAGAVTNIADTDFTVKSLSYQFGATLANFFHTTQIQPGGTLLATGGLNVAPDAGDVPTQNWTAHVTVTGSTATLQVGQTGTNTANMVVGCTLGHHETSSHSTGRLDLSGLGTFVANLNRLSLGQGVQWNNRGYAQLTLADHNQINAKTIETGFKVGHANVLLGQDNTIRANTMYVNMGMAPLEAAGLRNEVRFQTGLTNPVLNLRGLDGEGVDLSIATNVSSNTGGTSVGIMDLSGGSFNATLNNLTVGYFSYVWPGAAAGTLIMDDGLVTANNVMLARTNANTTDSRDRTTGTITMRGGTFVALGAVEDGGGVSTINVNGGTFVSQGALAVDSLNVGTSTGAGTFQMNGLAVGSRNVGTLTLGANGNILLRANPYGAGTIVATTATLAAGSTVEIGPLAGSSTDVADRSVWTAGAGTWDATQTNWSNGLPAGNTIVNGQAYTFLQATTLTNGGLALANSLGWSLNVDSTSATLTRTGADITTGPVRAVIDGSSAVVTRSDHLTVAEAAGADAAMLEVKSGQLAIGAAGDPKNLTLGSGAAAGQLLQSGGTVTVYGNVVDGGASTVNLNAGTMNVTGSFQVDSLALGKDVGAAVLNLDSADAVTHSIGSDVVLADGDRSSGTIRVLSGTLTVAGGIVGGGGKSALYIDGGSLDSDAIPLIGTSPANVTIQGDLKVDELRVGHMFNEGGAIVGGKATLTVVGGDVAIGSGSGTLNIGRRVDTVSAHPQGDRFWGIADFSAAACVAIDVENLWLGISRTLTGGNPSTGPNTVGELYLCASGPNTVRAAEIIAGDVPLGSGASPAASKIVFGGSSNDVQTDSLTLGGRKGWGQASLVAGGTLTLIGLTEEKTNLYIGDNNVSTNSRAIGSLITSAGAFNAALGEVVLGHSPYGSSEGTAYGDGSLAMGAGTVTADYIRMAQTGNTINPDLTKGTLTLGGGSFTVGGDVTGGAGVVTLNLNGGHFTAQSIVLGQVNSVNQSLTANPDVINLVAGSLTAASIGKGPRNVNFNFTGGTLHVDQFGSAALPFNLVQQGGTLAPGRSIGTTAIYGDYTQAAAGTLEIEIASLTAYDLVTVNGSASLSGTLNVLMLDDYAAELGHYFDILTTTGDLTVDFAGITGDSPNPVFGWWETSVIEGVDGFALRLSAVPEPGSALLALLGLAILLGCRRRCHGRLVAMEK